jgi:hypothetical protein
MRGRRKASSLHWEPAPPSPETGTLRIHASTAAEVSAVVDAVAAAHEDVAGTTAA